jgi:hypothetical protein
MSSNETVDFAPSVLGSLDVLIPSGQAGTDLACELGLSAWMRRTGTSLDAAPARLWAIRQAVIEAGGLDPATEPIPLGGRSPRLKVLSLVAYLGELVDRAATRLGCDRTEVIALALERPVLQGIDGAPAGRLVERRSS